MSSLNGLQGSGESRVECVGNTNPSGKGMNGNCYSSDGVNPTLTTNKGEENKVVIPVLTPDRANKRQNGRRFKEDGEEAFTLTGQDRHGVAVEVSPEVIGNAYESCGQNGNIYMDDGIAPTLQAGQGVKGRGIGSSNSPKVAIQLEPMGMSGYELSESEDEAHSLNCSDQRKVFGAHQTRTMVGYNATLKRGGGIDRNGKHTDGEGLQRTGKSGDDHSNDMFLIDKGIRADEREVANCIEARENRGLSKRKQEGTLICRILECCDPSGQNTESKSESNTKPEK